MDNVKLSIYMLRSTPIDYSTQVKMSYTMDNMVLSDVTVTKNGLFMICVGTVRKDSDLLQDSNPLKDTDPLKDLDPLKDVIGKNQIIRK